MFIRKIFLRDDVILVIATCFMLIGCVRPNHQNKTNSDSILYDSAIITFNSDTLFNCAFIQIRDQVWMRNNLSVKKFRNGDSLKQALSIDDWLFYTDKKTPVFMEVDIDTRYYNKLIIGYTKNYLGRYFNYIESPDKANYFLYNQYAILDDRALCPNGWRMPTKSDWQTLFNIVKSDKHLLDSIGVVKSFGNKYGFSLRPTPYGFASNEYDFNMSFAIFWLAGAKKVMLNTFYDDENEFTIPPHMRWQESNKYDGCCVRCIKE